MGQSSRLIIADMILSDTHASSCITFMGISMVAFIGMERTETQLLELLNSVGLSVVRIEYLDQGSRSPDCMIEANLYEKAALENQ